MCYIQSFDGFFGAMINLDYRDAQTFYRLVLLANNHIGIHIE